MTTSDIIEFGAVTVSADGIEVRDFIFRGNAAGLREAALGWAIERLRAALGPSTPEHNLPEHSHGTRWLSCPACAAPSTPEPSGLATLGHIDGAHDHNAVPDAARPDTCGICGAGTRQWPLRAAPSTREPSGLREAWQAANDACHERGALLYELRRRWEPGVRDGWYAMAVRDGWFWRKAGDTEEEALLALAADLRAAGGRTSDSHLVSDGDPRPNEDPS